MNQEITINKNAKTIWEGIGMTKEEYEAYNKKYAEFMATLTMNLIKSTGNKIDTMESVLKTFTHKELILASLQGFYLTVEKVIGENPLATLSALLKKE